MIEPFSINSSRRRLEILACEAGDVLEEWTNEARAPDRKSGAPKGRTAISHLSGGISSQERAAYCSSCKEWASVRPIASARGSIRRVYLFYSVRVVTYLFLEAGVGSLI